ncbi:hypothetical protein HBH56_100700 [Parastagonospora nodorum]|uniref:Uncharacterized protein n=1 Tax=Phaeosphaeria nodorum (strain SN15 / ATCC MYA-4574 / FGSC 10173) TaxID=321614 RepID=A0A7U2NRA8_PHANO|nr:hypothetical protein HBH56_100700 [Parastagonospora nodorum]QRD07546.1 hypothetical protein JI435_424570 [Parastagonospora nodorum SN15]KAH3930595.1 hypothetical protein HBH54_115020 [Parastagonospora nodorum]KAH3964494.1 hypothetical protein HBH51_157050 [Parastagonospora nodorum]KAH4133274.1 hypothetical protein HBH47_000750 [Parastagonospora nodorum]
MIATRHEVVCFDNIAVSRKRLRRVRVAVPSRNTNCLARQLKLTGLTSNPGVRNPKSSIATNLRAI